MSELQGMKLVGYIGRWSEVDREEICGITYALMEHDTLGDMTCYVVVDITNNKILGDTYDNIETFLVDEGIVDIDELHGGC